MLLTRKELHRIIQDWRIGPIPRELEKELLEVYGHDLVTEEGLTLEYSEQDIVEQLQKVLRPFSQLMHSEDPSFSTVPEEKEDRGEL